MVLGDKAVCLCIYLTLAVTVGYRLEQGEYIHTMTTLIAAFSSWITVGAVASKGTINCCWGIANSQKLFTALVVTGGFPKSFFKDFPNL